MSLTTRQSEIIDMAAGPHAEPVHIPYTNEEDGVWRTITEALEPAWQKNVAAKVLSASERLALSPDHVPQLNAISNKLHRLTNFTFRAVGGLASQDKFFGGLARNQFLSTQYIRDAGSPFYTQQPDIVHEVIGHGTLLADPDFAELHRLAGAALIRAETERTKSFIANVWWFAGEFGVIQSKGAVKAIGAGILSSLSELNNIIQADIKPLDLAEMGTMPYRVDQLQPTLFAGQSTDHFINVVGSFFETTTDRSIQLLTKGDDHEI